MHPILIYKKIHLSHNVRIFSDSISVFGERSSSIEVSPKSDDVITEIFSYVHDMVNHVINRGTVGVTFARVNETAKI